MALFRRRVSAGDLVDPLGALILRRCDAEAELIFERAGKGAAYGVSLPVGDLNDLLVVTAASISASVGSSVPISSARTWLAPV